MIAVLLAAALQDTAELGRAVENTSKAKSYAFSYTREGEGRNRRGSADITGVYTSKAMYIKAGKIEIVQAAAGTMVSVEGEWMTPAEARAKIKAAGEESAPKISLDDLLKFPAPHTLLKNLLTWVPKWTAQSGAFEGELASTAPRALQELPWFRQGDEREIYNGEGTGKVTLDGEPRVTGLEFVLKGNLDPDPGRRPPSGPPSPQNPPRGPGAARRMSTPSVTFRVAVRLEKFDAAELPVPETVAKKLGLK